MNRTRISTLALALPLGIALAGCDGNFLGLGDDGALALSFAVPVSASAAAASDVSLAAVPWTDDAHTLELQEVEVTFEELKLEHSLLDSAVDESDSDSDGYRDEEIERGPVTIALPVEGGVITPLDESLPAGLYEKLEMKGGDIRLVGTFDGEAFDVTIPADAELEFEFEPPLELASGDDRLSVTVKIDLASWFRADDGTLIDPRLLTTDDELLDRFEDRVEASFEAFEDEDRDADEADSDSDADSDGDSDES